MNRIRTSGREDIRELDARRDARSGGIVLSGEVRAGAPGRTIRFTAANPTLYAVTVLKEVLEQKGIHVSGEALDLDDTTMQIDYRTMTPLVTQQSPPLSRIIEHVNKRSQNLYAELLFRTLGAVCAGEGSTEKSVKVMKQTLADLGIRPDSLAIYDGSGLSRLNLVTPQQTVALLDAMSGRPDFRYFYRSLPLAGSEGTLLTRMRNTDAENNVRAKTGTLTHMVALSGYVQGKAGRLLAFSIMSNNCLHPAADIRRLQDEMCRRLVRFWKEQ
jgi:D-alanyl-D-alanine carboxypeptidase/D-alanyl-D-alanine-endopeptidase (penicillin-binding protein 4)